MTHVIKRAIIAIVAVVLLVPTVASAHAGHDHDTDESTVTTTMSEINPEQVKKYAEDLKAKLKTQKDDRMANMEQARADLKERLSDLKKKICEKHQDRINTLISGMNKRRQNVFDRITKASDAVQAFYTEKSLSVENYDEILAKVTAAKEAAETAMSNQKEAETLNCSSDQPRADMSVFKEVRSTSVDAMRLYRDTVKELVAAVKEAAAAAKTTTETTEEGAEQ